MADGRVQLTVGDQTVELTAGQDLTAPAGTRHGYRAVGDGPARMLVEVVPPGGMAAFLDAVHALAEAGRTTRGGRPRLRDAAELFRDHADDVILPGIPGPVQRTLWRTLAVGRRRPAAGT